jgi:cytochrome c oxidase subunit 2
LSAARDRRHWPRRVLPLSVAAAAALIGLGGGTARAGALLPERGGSPNADRIASLYAVVLVLAAIVFAGVTAALVFALVHYRESRSPVAAQIRGNTRLEIAWTCAATILIVFIAAFSFSRFGAIEHPDRAAASPAAGVAAGVGDGGRGALHIEVVGRQYVWMFKYPNGAYSYEEMVAPVGVTVDLDIVSVDVAHSWWIPKLGGKLDAVPGYVNHTWFRIERPGVYRGQCAELCGRDHADMLAQVRGVAPAAYARWVRRQRQLIAGANGAAARERRQAMPARP